MTNLNNTQNLSMVWTLALLNSFWPWIVLGIVKQSSSITNKFSRFETTGRKLTAHFNQKATLYLVLLMLSDSQTVPMIRTIKVGTCDEHHTEYVYGVDLTYLALLNSFLVVNCSWDCVVKLFSY